MNSKLSTFFKAAGLVGGLALVWYLSSDRSRRSNASREQLVAFMKELSLEMYPLIDNISQ